MPNIKQKGEFQIKEIVSLSESSNWTHGVGLIRYAMNGLRVPRIFPELLSCGSHLGSEHFGRDHVNYDKCPAYGDFGDCDEH